MGIPQAVSQNVGKFHQSGADANKADQDLIIRITEMAFFYRFHQTQGTSQSVIRFRLIYYK